MRSTWSTAGESPWALSGGLWKRRVSVTASPIGNSSEQSAPHEMPAGALVTCPLPAPCLFTVRVAAGEKVAVTVLDSVTEMMHAALPEQKDACVR